MKIKSTHPESQGPFVLINDEDFDPSTMEEFEPAGEEAHKPAPARHGAKHKTTAED